MHPCYLVIRRLSSLGHLDERRLFRISGVPFSCRVRKICETLSLQLPTNIKTQLGNTPPWLLNQIKFIKITETKKSDLLPGEAQQLFSYFLQEHMEFRFFYTDGSKIAEKVGCAFVYHSTFFQDRLSDNMSVTSGEQYAIYRTLQFIKSRNVQRSVICIDSTSALLAASAFCPSSPIARNIQDIFHDLTNLGFVINFLWIPSHMGIPGNDRADNKAKEAINLEVSRNVSTDHSEYIPLVKEHIHAFCNTMWMRHHPNTNLKQVKDRVEEWESASRPSRREEMVLSRLRLGHSRLTHSFLLDRSARPECDRCQCYMSVGHILLECRKYIIPRQKIIQVCTSLNVPFCLKTILGNIGTDMIDATIQFCKEANLFQLL